MTTIPTLVALDGFHADAHNTTNVEVRSSNRVVMFMSTFQPLPSGLVDRFIDLRYFTFSAESKAFMLDYKHDPRCQKYTYTQV